jgi:hypothetical protein
MIQKIKRFGKKYREHKNQAQSLRTFQDEPELKGRYWVKVHNVFNPTIHSMYQTALLSTTPSLDDNHLQIQFGI